MNYIGKCVNKTDKLMNKLNPSRNLIIFIVSENVYIAYTLNEIKEIMTPVNNHYVEDKFERFFYLSNKIVIDSSLKTCFNNNVNTMKLVKSKNKFSQDNKEYYDYYTVEAVSRQSIGSDEESTFNTEYEDKNDNDTNLLSKVESNTVEKAKEKPQIERKLDNRTSSYTVITHYENGIECKTDYTNEIKRRETWFTNNILNRDNDLPTRIEYYENGSKKSEEWWKNGRKHRTNDNPACIDYYENGNKKSEEWSIGDQVHRDNDLPAFIEYFENGNKESESWWVNGQQHRDNNDLYALIEYYENGNKQSEEWWKNGQRHRNNDLPARIHFHENGNKRSEEWWTNNRQRRNKDPIFIEYDEDGTKQYEEY